MQETQLTSRQIKVVLLVVVMFIGGLMTYTFTVFPSNDDLPGSRRWAMGTGLATALATLWFGKLIVDSIQDKRRGTDRPPAKVTGWFHVLFGSTVMLGGITCSALDYSSTVAAVGGIWTLYYGMIGWGALQMLLGLKKLRSAI